MKIKDPTIALEKYDNVNHISRRIGWQQWVDAVSRHMEYFVWSEDTVEGKTTLAKMDDFPKYLREGMLQQLDKRKVYAEYNRKKEYYEVILQYSDKFGTIHSTFMRPVTTNHLVKLLDIASYLNAHLLNHGNEIIDSSYLSNKG